MAVSAAILDAIDERLRMLDARADGERLGLERDAAAVQELVDRARRVADGEHHRVADELAARGAAYADDAAVADEQIDDGVGPDVGGAARFEVRALRHQDLRQAIGADVRSRLDEDLGIRPMGDQGAQHTAHRPPIFRARV